MWESVGYTSIDAGDFHRKFLSREISHQEWCDITAKKLRERMFSKAHLEEIISHIKPVSDIKETVWSLKKQGTSVHIVSGSIKDVITSVIGDVYPEFSSIKSNEAVFDENGIIESISGTKYDFRGKARFIKLIIEELDCSPLDVLFVGNSLNDSWAAEAGARTLCVNPADVDYSNTHVWSDYIKEMKSLQEILPFARRADNRA